MQGTQTNSTNPLVREVVDLDALLTERSLEPTPVKLAGKVYKVRTDLTVEEVNQFLALMRATDNKNVEALTVLVGKRDAVSLDKAVAKLPLEHQAIANAHLMRASRALAQYAITDDEINARYGEPGESTAS